jgi:hypothetical protein
MPTKVILVLAAALMPLGCSSGGALKSDGGASGGHAGSAGLGGFAGTSATDAGGDAAQQNPDDALIVPQGLPVSLEEGGAGVFNLFALTLRDEADGLVLYAALQNTDPTTPACDAALRVTLYDKSNQQIGMFINGLYTSHFYNYTRADNSITVAACASPGDIAMTQIDTMATDITVADIGSVVYYYSYFVLDPVVLIDGLTVSQVTPTTTSAGTSYTGTVVNQLSTMVSQPSIAVFPVNSVGRPLGIAKAGDNSQVPAGGNWTFQTTTVDMAGVNYAAFPSASFNTN